MTYRYFPPLGRDVSAIGFGAWEIGGADVFAGQPSGWGAVDGRQAQRAVGRALELGITFFDTADVYGRGRSEELLGEALGRQQSAAVVCTKFGNRETRAGKPRQDFSPAWLAESVAGSLRRLTRERLDVLLLHGPPDDFKWSTYDPAPFERLKAAGTLGAYGVSCHSVKSARQVIESGFGNVIEVIYNMLDRRAEERVLPLAASRGVAVIARMPLASGFLTPPLLGGKPRFAAGDHRATLLAADVAWRQAAARQLEFLQREQGGLPTSALRFCLSHPAVTCVIPGMSTVEQVEANALAADLGPLPDTVMKRVTRAVPHPYQNW